ncbi:MAG TPA: hypothetical protein VGE52_05875 [Pirellulales bacterium]
MLFADWTTFDYVSFVLAAVLAYGLLRWWRPSREPRVTETARRQLREMQAAREPQSVVEAVMIGDEEIPAEVVERIRWVAARTAQWLLGVEEGEVDPKRLRVEDVLDDTLGWHVGGSELEELDISLEEAFGGRWNGHDFCEFVKQFPEAHELPQFGLRPRLRHLLLFVARRLKAEGRVIEPGVDYSAPKDAFRMRWRKYWWGR